MNHELGKLEEFIASWREPLERMAKVFFALRMLDETSGTPAQIADAFAADHDFNQIGFNWELLDPAAELWEARSALGAFKDALSLDLAMRSKWLEDENAQKCGAEFMAAFKPLQCMFLTNHIIREEGKSEMWFPVTSCTYDWAFVGMDDRKIAMLVVSAND